MGSDGWGGELGEVPVPGTYGCSGVSGSEEARGGTVGEGTRWWTVAEGAELGRGCWGEVTCGGWSRSGASWMWGAIGNGGGNAAATVGPTCADDSGQALSDSTVKFVRGTMDQPGCDTDLEGAMLRGGICDVSCGIVVRSTANASSRGGPAFSGTQL